MSTVHESFSRDVFVPADVFNLRLKEVGRPQVATEFIRGLLVKSMRQDSLRFTAVIFGFKSKRNGANCPVVTSNLIFITGGLAPLRFNVDVSPCLDMNNYAAARVEYVAACCCSHCTTFSICMPREPLIRTTSPGVMMQSSITCSVARSWNTEM